MTEEATFDSDAIRRRGITPVIAKVSTEPSVQDLIEIFWLIASFSDQRLC
ncbi:hypothetical protein [Halorubrum ezzemoulense]|nr:hypothetical protein [Halorubrum ezzemoulense]MDB2249556.1 hypothetical protein [Halorubrum ezzemoulense]